MCHKGEAVLYTVLVETDDDRPTKRYVGSSESVMIRLEQHEAMQNTWCKGKWKMFFTTNCIACATPKGYTTGSPSST